VLFSGDADGVLAACGCPSNPSGGLAKREALTDEIRRTRPYTLLIDSGDLFPEKPNRVKLRYLAEAVGGAEGHRPFDAIGMGDQEFALGLPMLRELEEKYDLRFLCANVRDEADELVVAPHLVHEIGGSEEEKPRWRIGIFSVIADEVYGFPPVEWRTGLKVESPIEAARREVEELKDCDLIIAISHQSLDNTRELAAKVPGIGIVICGHDAPLLAKPEKVGGAIVVASGPAGRVLGAVTVTAGADRRPRLTTTMTELSAQVPDSKRVMDLYWAYVKEAKELPPPDWSDYAPIPDRYESAEACGKCHPAELKSWSATRHARAYESIRKSGRQDDPECVLCHTMGFGRPGGFESIEKTPALGRVTCQACHAVTADHFEKKVNPEAQLRISSRMCMSCHGPVQSPDFDYYVAKPKIRHRPPASESKK
jgi:nitrate/TMAO reductase-like tetraheme cytochrome c subunit